MAIVSGFAVGIVGSMHCAGMCGPLAIALPVPQTGRARYIAGRVLYNLGRVVTYMVLGAVAGLVGRRLFMAGAQQTVSIVIGALMLLFVLAPALLRRLPGGGTLIARVTSPVRTALGRLLQRSSVLALFLLGLVNGLLPCGLVYVALAAAITSGDTLSGVLFMAGFGLGTVPVMLAIALVGKQLQGGLRRRLSTLLPVFTGVIAVLILLRGLNLGIPFISPKVMGEPQHEQVDCCE